MPTFKFDKLVRDKIVVNQLRSGAKPQYKYLTRGEHQRKLVEKIIEESGEVLSASKNDVASEIADIKQALEDLMKLYKLKPKDIEKKQLAKNKQNGPFSKGIYIDNVQIEKNNSWFKYYKDNSDRYPQVD